MGRSRGNVGGRMGSGLRCSGRTVFLPPTKRAGTTDWGTLSFPDSHRTMRKTSSHRREHMRRLLGVLMGIGLVVGAGCQSQSAEARVGAAQEGLKVFISVDMEGIAGVTAGSDVSSTGPDYEYFRRLTTLEANAAVEGALAAGATEIVVRDGHGAKTNIIPDLLHQKARLLRGVTARPENMMLGLDESFRRGDLHRLPRQGRYRGGNPRPYVQRECD